MTKQTTSVVIGALSVNNFSVCLFVLFDLGLHCLLGPISPNSQWHIWSELISSTVTLKAGTINRIIN